MGLERLDTLFEICRTCCVGHCTGRQIGTLAGERSFDAGETAGVMVLSGADRT